LQAAAAALAGLMAAAPAVLVAVEVVALEQLLQVAVEDQH
jgi:hypothetical protein